MRCPISVCPLLRPQMELHWSQLQCWCSTSWYLWYRCIIGRLPHERLMLLAIQDHKTSHVWSDCNHRHPQTKGKKGGGNVGKGRILGFSDVGGLGSCHFAKQHFLRNGEQKRQKSLQFRGACRIRPSGRRKNFLKIISFLNEWTPNPLCQQKHRSPACIYTFILIWVRNALRWHHQEAWGIFSWR